MAHRLARFCARPRDMARRALACPAAAVMIGAVGAALLQWRPRS